MLETVQSNHDIADQLTYNIFIFKHGCVFETFEERHIRIDIRVTLTISNFE